MHKIGILVISVLIALFSNALSAAEAKIAYVNVVEIYNKSSFVEKANKTLQEKVKKMESQLQDQRKKIQTLVTTYEKTTAASKKEDLAKKITTEQTALTNMTQDFQKKIQAEQNTGMQDFTKLVQKAVEKIAKDKQVNTVLNSTSILYTDGSWIDITKDTATSMQN